MNQIKLKIEEIGLSQREISVRLGKNASYLAGVFRTGLSTAKQAELMDGLDIVANGGTLMSDEELIKDLFEQMDRLKKGNAQLRVESDKYFNELNEAQNAGIKALESYGIVQNQLTQTQKYLLEANQEVEQIESKYRAVLIFNYVLSLVILGIAISWVLV